jgi:hypothetical protein
MSRWIQLYLAVYSALIVGAMYMLWRAGMVAQLPRHWVALALCLAVGAAILLAIVYRGPAQSDAFSSPAADATKVPDNSGAQSDG